MANRDLHSDNIDSFNDFDFRTLNEDDEIEVSEQNYRSFPLSIITQRNGILNVNVILEIYKWDYWLRNYSINKFKSAFEKTFVDLNVNGISKITFEEVTEQEENEYVLLCWNLQFPAPRSNKEIKTKILNSVDVILYKTRIQLEENRHNDSPTGFKRFFLINGSAYQIGVGTFWVALPIICGFAYFLGTVKYDADKISLADDKKALQDTVKIRDNTIRHLRHNSDSALTILGGMPYNEIRLDSVSFRKIQTNIENAGAALYLNK